MWARYGRLLRVGERGGSLPAVSSLEVIDIDSNVHPVIRPKELAFHLLHKLQCLMVCVRTYTSVGHVWAHMRACVRACMRACASGWVGG